MEDEAAALIDANAKGQSLQVATLGGGCFWCTKAVFSELKGVEKVEPGYSGGTVPNLPMKRSAQILLDTRRSSRSVSTQMSLLMRTSCMSFSAFTIRLLPIVRVQTLEANIGQ